MAKDILQQAGKRSGDTIIKIPESVRKNLPKDFDIDVIGKIDLREAETIANEDILIKENEILAGLEDFEIIPLKEQAERPPIRAAESRHAERAAIASATLEREITGEAEEAEERVRDEAVTEKEVLEEKGSPGKDLEYNDGRKWISLEELEKYDEHGQKWMPLEELVLDDGTAGLKDKESKEKITSAPEIATDGIKVPAAEKRGEMKHSREKIVMVEGYVEHDDEYIIWDKPTEDKARGEKKVSTAAGSEQRHGDVQHEPVIAEEKKPRETLHDKRQSAGDEEVVISIEDLEGTSKTAKNGEADLTPIGYEESLKQGSGDVAILGRPERLMDEQITMRYKDLLSSGILAGSKETGTVYFIDDTTKGKEREDRSIFDESELDKIISGIVQVDEGSAYMLREANVDEDRERIAVISEEFAPSHEELFVDLDYKYGDEELDYIHTAIVEEDYGSYIREIDEFFGIPGGRTIPAAVELLGLTADEFDTIEDKLFQDEFKDIHLYDRYHLYEFDRSSREGMAKDRKNCRYLLPDENSLMDFERDSIESDVSSGSALIFEEDIHDITEQLSRRSGKTEEQIRELIEKTFGVETLMEKRPDETGAVPGVGQGESMPAAEPAGAGEGIFDITDRVVILDNEADVDRFVKEFPAGKQMNIKMLLKYLDGLFETLPEEIIKKFASSEYFELYLKVLNELGV